MPLGKVSSDRKTQETLVLEENFSWGKIGMLNSLRRALSLVFNQDESLAVR